MKEVPRHLEEGRSEGQEEILFHREEIPTFFFMQDLSFAMVFCILELDVQEGTGEREKSIAGPKSSTNSCSCKHKATRHGSLGLEEFAELC